MIKIVYNRAPPRTKLIGTRVTHHRVADREGTIVSYRHKKGAFRNIEVKVQWDNGKVEWCDLGNVAF